MTYREIYVIMFLLNRKSEDDIECKKKIMEELIKIYRFQNNRLPDGVEHFL